MKKIIFYLLILFSFPALAGTNEKGWNAAYESPQRFIENKSQFDGRDNLSGSAILFGVELNGTQIYFTKQGLTYRFDKRESKKQNEESENKAGTPEAWIAHENEEHNVKIETELVHLQWENANPNVEVVGEEKTNDYFSYSVGKENINHISAFKKIIYKNLYPNIDVVYEFHPKGGIKYSLILHPGADVSKVKMKYSNSKKIFADKNGNIHITTLVGDIIDHAPQTFYSENKSSLVSSRFAQNGKTISFSVGSYDKSKTIVVDPWVQTPTIASSNAVQECEHDGTGNVYIIGGETPMKLLKYNSAGVLQWTYATPYDTVGGEWLGTFATDFAGNSYVTCGSSAALTKVNTSGGVVYSVNGGTNDEYWNIAFNCDQTKLIIGGTRLTFNLATITGSGVIFDINAANGSVNSLKTVGYTVPSFLISNPNEVRSITSSHNGRYYYLTLDTIGCIDQNFSACPSNNGAPIFAINSGYNFSYKCENYRPNNGNGGIMSIRANKNFVYTANGTNIQKRSLANGSILATAAIPGGINIANAGSNQIGNSGIDIDTCGNVYVGSSLAIIEYDANLNQLSSVTLPFTVYDVSVNTNGDVIAAGAVQNNSATSRTGYVQAISSFAACKPLTLQCCDATICNAGPFCSTDPATNLSPSTSGGTWSGTGITNTSTGTFDPSVAGQGTFVITYNLGCGKDSMTIVVKTCNTLTVCVEPNGDLTASGGVNPYHWDVAGTANDCSACLIVALCQPPAANCPQIVTTWSTYSTNATTATPPGTFPIRVIDSQGNTLVINSLTGIPSCNSILNTSTTQTNVLCHGSCTGSATVTATSGTPPYTYSWSPSGGTTSTATGLCSGNYTVTVIDSGTLTATSTVSITQPLAILSSTATATSASCGSGGSANVNASGGTTAYTYSWSSGQSTANATGLPAGNYTATVTDANGCITTSTVSITAASGGTLSVNSVSIKCNGDSTGTASAAMSGGTSPFTYAWSSGQSTSAVSNLPAGNYTITVADAGGCTNTQTVSITQPAAITASTTITNTTCGSSTGTANVSASGGTGSLTYSWSNGPTTPAISNLGVGNYTCTITDANGCTNIQTANIINANGPTATATSTSVTCHGDSNGTASATASGGTSPYTYSWNTTPPQTSQNATGLSAGIYTVTVTDAAGCSNTQTVAITQPAAINLIVGTSTTIVSGNSASLSASGGVTYSWSPSAGLSCTNCSDPVASPSQTTTYCVYVSDASGCSDSACVTITIEAPCSNSYYFPNAFSPNGDGDNDALHVFVANVDCIKEYQLQIYDRWGEKLFDSTDPTLAWDGTFKGKTMNTQVVVYYLHIVFVDNTEISKKGNVSLVR